MLVYRYYQIAIINQIIKSISNNHARPLIVLPTASGKTVIMAGLLNQLTALHGQLSSLIVVPFSSLRKQIAKQMTLMGVKTDIITYNGTLHLTPQSKDIILCDEAHHIMSPAWRNLPSIVSSTILCGFTGTPYRSDAEKLLECNDGIFDDLIMGPTMDELTKQGFLANLEYYSYPIKKVVTEYPFRFMGKTICTSEVYHYKIDNREGQIINEYAEHFNGMPAIIFARNVKHASEIAQKFNGAGISARDINCYQPSKIKEEIVDAVQQKHVKVLVGCNMMSEGLDAPHLKLAIMARPIVESLTLFLQQIGRVIRPYNNETAKVLDLVGNVYRFNTPSKAAQRRIE